MAQAQRVEISRHAAEKIPHPPIVSQGEWLAGRKKLLAHEKVLTKHTPYGRQQEFEDSPPGWPQKPTYG